MYKVLKRRWFPKAGHKKTLLYCHTEEEARRICLQYNAFVDRNPFSVEAKKGIKLEYEEVKRGR